MSSTPIKSTADKIDKVPSATYHRVPVFKNGGGLEDSGVLITELADQASVTMISQEVGELTADFNAFAASKGQPSGLASLDPSGFIPVNQIPGSIDDVLEYANLAAFPNPGTSGKIYVAIDTKRTYRWSGSIYVEISPSDVLSVDGATGAVTLSNTYQAKHVNLTGLSTLTSTANKLAYFTGTNGASALTDLTATGRSVIGASTPLAARTATGASGKIHEDITDYGAVADDATDNTAAITNAITAAKTGTRAIYVPPGVFRTKKITNLDRCLIVYGRGTGDPDLQAISHLKLIPTPADPNDAVFEVTGAAYPWALNFRDLTFIGPGQGSGSNCGILIHDCVDVSTDMNWSNLYFRGFGKHAVCFGPIGDPTTANLGEQNALYSSTFSHMRAVFCGDHCFRFLLAKPGVQLIDITHLVLNDTGSYTPTGQAFGVYVYSGNIAILGQNGNSDDKMSGWLYLGPGTTADVSNLMLEGVRSTAVYLDIFAQLTVTNCEGGIYNLGSESGVLFYVGSSAELVLINPQFSQTGGFPPLHNEYIHATNDAKITVIGGTRVTTYWNVGQGASRDVSSIQCSQTSTKNIYTTAKRFHAEHQMQWNIADSSTAGGVKRVYVRDGGVNTVDLFNVAAETGDFVFTTKAGIDGGFPWMGEVLLPDGNHYWGPIAGTNNRLAANMMPIGGTWAPDKLQFGNLNYQEMGATSGLVYMGSNITWSVANSRLEHVVTGATAGVYFYFGEIGVYVGNSAAAGSAAHKLIQITPTGVSLGLNETGIKLSFYSSGYYMQTDNGLELGSPDKSRVIINGTERTKVDATGLIVTGTTVSDTFSGALAASNVTGTLGVTQGGNGLATATLGDLRYGSGTNTLTALAGNTTTTLKLLTQTGNGSISAAPAWNDPATAGLPTLSGTQTFSGANTFSGLPAFTNAGNYSFSGNIYASADGKRIGNDSANRFLITAYGLASSGTPVAGNFTWGTGTSALRFSSGFFDLGSAAGFRFSAGDPSATAPDIGVLRTAIGIAVLYDNDQTGDPGFGIQAKSTTTAKRDRFRLTTSAVDNTDASRKYRAIFNVYDTVARSAIQLDTDGTTAIASFPGWAQLSSGRKRLTADVTNVTTTFSNLTNLSVTLLAGRKYTGRLVIKCNNGGASGIKFDFNGGAATMTSFWAAAVLPIAGGSVGTGTLISTSLSGVIDFTELTGEQIVVIEFSFVCNAAGTFIPRFANDINDATTSTVELGSNLWIDDIAN